MTRSLSLVPAALGLGLALAPAVSLAQEPPAMFRGGPQHSGVTDTRGLERLHFMIAS